MANLTLIPDDEPVSMPAADDLVQFAVVIGNLHDGFSFLGPFPTHVAAQHWGRKLYRGDPEGVAETNDTWWVVPLQEPHSYLNG
jgi:hypothetical protein